MDVPLWLIWVVATLLAIMPLSVIPMAMKVDKVRPKKLRAKGIEFTPMVACEGFIAIDGWSEDDWYDLLMIISQSQMRQRWGKDIDHIV